jgi:hypothetical protein
VYTVVLSNRLATTIPGQVPKALTAAGLPSSSVAGFLTAYTTGTQAAFDAVQGLTPAILTKGTTAYKNASADAYRTVFLTTLAFSGIGIILTWFAPDVDKKLTREVAVTLHKKADGVRAEAGLAAPAKSNEGFQPNHIL